ncbi:hypothetical protein HY632_04540 [Candidatus Uhrbacteria bacterium]|nr:hypothetical protein [Candidatus Uhrbacteria bacterium]
MAIPSCVYCFDETGAGRTFGKGDGEHVIPKLLGEFSPRFLLRGDLVCDQCNNEFSGGIEEYLARCTLEGLIAAIADRRPDCRPVFRLNTTSLSMEIRTLPHTPVPTLYLLLAHYSEDLAAAGVIILHDGGTEYAIVHIERWLAKSSSKSTIERYFRRMSPFRTNAASFLLLGDDSTLRERGELALRLLGIRYRGWVDLRSEHVRGPIQCRVAFRQSVGSIHARAIAKIAFNYFAYCAGQQYREHLFHERYRPIRQFIRYAEGDDFKQFVTMTADPWILPSSAHQGQRYYHVAFLEEPPGRIMARVNFVSNITYVVDIGPYPFQFDLLRGMRRQFGCGHSFDCTTWIASPLRGRGVGVPLVYDRMNVGWFRR